MKTVFMGTPDFAVPALEALIGAGHDVQAVVTQPDRPCGRGRALAVSPVKQAAMNAGICVLQPEHARDASFVGELSRIHPDICVVAAYGQILPQDILDIPEYGCVNIHASLLPRYRGASPIQWAVINGDEESGVTTMLMDAGMDTGDILEQESIKLAPKETGASLEERLSRLGAKLIVSTLRGLERGTIIPRPQDPSEATVVRKIEKSMGVIDFSDDAAYIERLIRGLDGASTTCRGKRLKIWSADAVESSVDAPCGTITEAAGGQLCIRTGSGVLKINELQLEGKKRMDTASFLRGFPMKAGERMGD